MKLHLNDTFNNQLPADTDTSNTRRQVFGACFSYVTPRVPSSPKLLHVTAEVTELIGLFSDADRTTKKQLMTTLSAIDITNINKYKAYFE